MNNASELVNVTLPVRIILRATTFVGPSGDRTVHWFGLSLFGHSIYGFGGERDNYPTREKALRAGRRAAREYASREREVAAKVTP